MDQLTLHSVNPTGMFSFGQCSDVNLHNVGLVHLLGVNEDKGGDSNGAGKTSLFNSICELLFLENPTGEKGESVVNSVWNKGMAGRVIFSNSLGRKYRVTYCRRWKDSLYPVDSDSHVSYVGTNLFLELLDGGVWRDCRGSGMPDTHKKILEAVGVDYQQFLSVAYMPARLGSQFLRGSNKDRMDLLSGIIGLEEWEKILEVCRSDRKVLTTKIGTLERSISFEKGAISSVDAQLKSAAAFDWTTYLSTLETELVSCRKFWSEANDKLKATNAELVKLRAAQEKSFNKDRVSAINAEIQELKEKLQKVEKSLSAPFLIQDNPTLLKELQANSKKLNETKGTLTAFLGSSGSILDMTNCPTCDSKISKEKKTKLHGRVEELQATISQYEVLCVQSQTAIDQDRKKKQQEKADSARTLKNEAESFRNLISEKVLQLQTEQSVYMLQEKEIVKIQNSLSVIQNDLNTYFSQGKDIKTKIDSANTSLANISSLTSHIQEKKKIIEDFEEERGDLAKEVDLYSWLIDNIPFIKLHKMSLSMSEISDLCNKFFEEMGDSLRINIKSFDEKTRKKNAADIKDLLKGEVKIEISDGVKNISPKLYSDGEISRVSIALIRAFHEMAKKSGRGCNVMLLDEIFSFVDGSNSQKISDSISVMLKGGTVILTDNSGNAGNLVSFDKTWVVRKISGKSTIELE